MRGIAHCLGRDGGNLIPPLLVGYSLTDIIIKENLPDIIRVLEVQKIMVGDVVIGNKQKKRRERQN